MSRTLKALAACVETSALASERITDIVANLRRFTRVDEAQRQMADINENIQSVVALMKPQLKRGVTVETYCGDVPEFPMFPSELNQVMATLIKNANDVIDHAGRITITTTTAAHLVRVTVADTGRGIPEELQPRLFDVGFATKGTRFGMRIGLSAALDTVDKHGGRIEVANSAGSGTTFTVELPAR